MLIPLQYPLAKWVDNVHLHCCKSLRIPGRVLHKGCGGIEGGHLQNVPYVSGQSCEAMTDDVVCYGTMSERNFLRFQRFHLDHELGRLL